MITTSRRGPPRAAPALLSLVLAALVLTPGIREPGRASAHADYERSLPAAGSVLPRAPERVEIWFTQELFRREGANVIEVRAGSGERVDAGDPVVGDRDRTRLSVGLAPGLAPGSYAVAWQTLSAVDGDTARGSFGFTLDPDAPEPPEPEAAAGPAPAATPGTEEIAAAAAAGGREPPWWILGAIAALAAAAVLGARALLAPARAARGPPG